MVLAPGLYHASHPDINNSIIVWKDEEDELQNFLKPFKKKLQQLLTFSDFSIIPKNDLRRKKNGREH
jgi:hypothetical protein